MQNENMPQEGVPMGGGDQNMGGGAPADSGAAPAPQGGGEQNMGGSAPADAAPMPEKKKPWWKFW